MLEAGFSRPHRVCAGVSSQIVVRLREVVLFCGNSLNQRRPDVVHVMSKGIRDPRHNHVASNALIDGVDTPGRDIVDLKAVLVRVILADRARVDGRCTEVSLDGGWHNESEGDVPVFYGHRLVEEQ